ncbi:DUF202 domain-containing protein [Maridesulfovibrio sp.]|jgi:putative membrane protein|uniref:YidH family protein n=1 Tax=Maridesulfovibrio sp. TaxID=2795000 RepID=UPI0029CA8416|nr:DUF202 domain-containing protein [Maridesulfovibrio sp.]
MAGHESDNLDNNELARMRTLLANERTFLAWCRTALGLFGFGFVIEKARLYMQKMLPGTPDAMLSEMNFLGVFIIMSGMVILVSAAFRFYRFEKSVGARVRWTTPYPELLVTVAVGVVLIFSSIAGKIFF